MAIKMRHNKDRHAVCHSCGAKAVDSLEMFDIALGRTVVTICDLCNTTLLNKTLSAEVAKSHRVKDSHDMAIIQQRRIDGRAVR